MKEIEYKAGELKPGEFHPSALSAYQWIRSLPVKQLYIWRESFASCAIEGNRLAEVCFDTISRVINDQSISDRYLLGLVYAMRFNEKESNKKRVRQAVERTGKAKGKKQV